ncbi:glycosyltransferase [Hankyongella ginsenosidimutans]|uniref:glycosyltransferase n=1 Tax=Hankyongella ginsenosidimutans TaxID=1763828 RepID=UPI001CA3119D|nr:glycosyltransferase [Hankyongella ginsenosidimutans]
MRVAQLVNHWGDAHEHLMVSSLPDQRGALDLIAPGARVTWLEDFPSLKAGRLWERLPTIGAALKRVKPDLLLTYNWGAVDVLLANRLFARLPAVHHEEGFGPEEAAGPLLRRSLYRRVACRGGGGGGRVARSGTDRPDGLGPEAGRICAQRRRCCSTRGAAAAGCDPRTAQDG